MKKILVIMFLFIVGLCMGGCNNENNNGLLRDQENFKWLKEIKSEDIIEVRIEYCDGMTFIGNTRKILSSKEETVMKEVYDAYYQCKVTPVTKEETIVDDGGSTLIQFYLSSKEAKEINLYAGFFDDENGNYFKAENNYAIDEEKFVTSYKFVIGEKMGKLYQNTSIMDPAYICDIPIGDIEFMELMDDIYLGDEVSEYYIETDFGKIHFLKDCYFYIERYPFADENDRNRYYQLRNTTLNEWIAKNTKQKDCSFEWQKGEWGHTMTMLCDCCDSPAVVEPHEDSNHDSICDICCYAFDTTGINGIYTPSLITVSLGGLYPHKNYNEILQDFSIWIQNDTLYLDSFIFAEGKIGEFVLGKNQKLSSKYNLDEFLYVNDESKDLVKELFAQESCYSIAICSYPERVPEHLLVELHGDLYYIYTLFELGISGSRDTVVVFKLNESSSSK